jgi:anti-sigma-K factor RskA
VEEIKAYIETGILELYVLGQLNAQEQAEVEEMADKYPRIRDEISAIEFAMEQYAIHHAIQPTSGLENKIFDKIAKQTAAAEQEPKAGPKTTALPRKNTQTTISILRFSLAACLGFLIITVVALYTAHHKLAIAHEQIAALTLDNEKYAVTVSFMKSENKDLQQIATITADPTWTSVKLAGTKIAPQANMIVYWHKDGHHVMVDHTKMALPENDTNHQYQLWALVNGKPVDLGVFDATTSPRKLLVAMKQIGTAQAFAVTLEKRGGSVNPTMEKLVAMGAVSI